MNAKCRMKSGRRGGSETCEMQNGGGAEWSAVFGSGRRLHAPSSVLKIWWDGVSAYGTRHTAYGMWQTADGRRQTGWPRKGARSMGRGSCYPQRIVNNTFGA
jgi:hypothetical protein